ncbi:unnamed protein product [Fraxinus pennsylvanica]|uniref:Uncharacterized protein n=1 Tax=Fraxinus pennsylvanica TaxID=56036 RepID=A0AAD2E6Q6_9LAMI|nr:unnamed protein product [Fraxinus pennsylvanica]
MQAIGAISKSRRFIRVLKNPSPCFFNSPERVKLSQAAENCSELSSPALCRRFHFTSSGTLHGNHLPMESYCQETIMRIPTHIMLTYAPYSTEANVAENDSAGTAKEVYDKMLKCVAEKKNCSECLVVLNDKQHRDVKLMVEAMKLVKKNELALQPGKADLVFRICYDTERWDLISKYGKGFVTSGVSLRQTSFDLWMEFAARKGESVSLWKMEKWRSETMKQHTLATGFSCAKSVLSRDICTGKKALWKHNLYGLTPDIGSAHHLLLHAKQHRDVKLMVEVMKLVKKNELPLQPGTADLVFSICYDTDRYDLISKYGRRFVTSGVRLRQTSFDLWMEFAARKGDSVSLWKIEKWRSEAMKKHSLATGFSCAKGFLLECKPENAAAIIQILNQNLSDAKRTGIVVELQKLVSEWPLEVVKHQKEENRKPLTAALQNDIPAMINTLSSLGVDVNVDMKSLTGNPRKHPKHVTN